MTVRRIIGIGILGILLAGGMPVRVAMAAPPAPSADTYGPSAPVRRLCVPLVSVFGAPICRQELRPESGNPANSEAASQPAMQRAAQAHGDNLERLKDLVWQRALIHKFGAAAITPTDAEVSQYHKTFIGIMDQSYAADKQTVAIVQDLLDKNNYTEENEKRLRGILDAAQMSIKLYDEKQSHTESLPDAYKFVVETAETQVARSMLTAWKQDKVLFDAYGGRLAIGRGSIVPIDAYAKFLAYIRADAQLKIIDPDYKDVLKTIDEEINAPQTFLPIRNPIYQNYFKDPEWQFNLANNPERLDKMKAALDTMPTLGPKSGVTMEEKDLIGKRSTPPSPN